MRLSEIDNNIRKEKKLIDRLFSRYSLSKDPLVHDQIISHIRAIYPTGITELDSALTEYRHLLAQDILDRLRGS